MLERRHERKSYGVAGHGHLCWITFRGEQAVRDRLDPRRLWKGIEVRRFGRSGGTEIHWTRPARAPVEHIEADVRRDPVEPRAQRRAALEAIDASPCSQQRLLDRVLRIERRAEHPVAVANQLRAVLLQSKVEFARCRSNSRRLHTGHPK